MSKALFAPFGLAGGLLAGMVGKKVFRLLWGLIDEQRPPAPAQRGLDVRKLALALLLEGAVFRAIRGLSDHGSRRVFAALTGSWPGEAKTAESSQPE